MHTLENTKIAIIGLGYVGLPLAVEFGKHYATVGFDINTQRISELNDGVDNTLEVESDELKASSQLSFTHQLSDIKDCNCYIVTVPTPIDKHRQPDLSPLKSASKAVAAVISKGAVTELVEQYPEHRFLIEAYWSRWPEMLGGAFDGTVAIVDQLRRRRVRLYGLTNWSAETFPYARERFDFVGWFDGIVVSGEIGVAKPSPQIFHHLFQRFGLEPGNAVFIDDHPPNIEAAESLGLESHHFGSPQDLRDYLAAAGLI